MPSSPTSSSLSSGKRLFDFPHRSRARKKHKLLDSIRDEPTASYLAHRTPADDEAVLRRSSRIRHAPDLLDSSPVCSARTKRFKDLEPSRKSSVQNKVDRQAKDQEISVVPSISEEGNWKSRLRNRPGKSREKRHLSAFWEINKNFKETSDSFTVIEEKDVNVGSSFRSIHISKNGINETGQRNDADPPAEKNSQTDVVRVDTHTQVFSKHATMLQSVEKIVSFIEFTEHENVSVHGGPRFTVADKDALHPQSMRAEEYGFEDHESHQFNKHPAFNDIGEKDILIDNNRETEHSLKHNDQGFSLLDGSKAGFRLKEGRRCGLCGCGNDGKPPKKLINESFDSENDAYEGSTASEEPNYNVWDGFEDGPGWLGRLLGPLHDRFGIARIWVHQHCAVWSPEVYFADLGCLKNVRAALCRGRALKCSRCGRPGATIGCRVDRCPKTYHLPCSRIEGCIFDHRKFLIACTDHRCFLHPHGSKHTLQIRKMKAKKLRLDLRKASNEARRKDLETEEKWLENCGEDEEFLKREGRRLHRDILRIAPVYIGGSSESQHLYQGWESVAGLEHVIQCMKEVVLLPLLYPEFFASLGLTPPRGVLLHGYPGTGKTHVVRSLIGACARGDKRIAYFARKGADCLGKYVGDAERQLRLLFQVAERSQPSIIFFDEIDGLAPRRSKQQDQTHSSVVSTLLSLLDGLKSRGSVIVIGATNRPDAVDPALRRPGRFDREIYFSLPTKKDRSSILSLHTRSWPKPLSGSLLSWIADQTIGYAGADIQALCAQVAMHALKRNFALEQLLSSAAKGVIQGMLPSLPSVEVEERDWLEALRSAPPPCSLREAGIAANDINAAPLPVHLIPCFLQPLTCLLVSFYVNEQIWLSSMLLKASESVKNLIVLTLEHKGIPSNVWWPHLDYLILDPLVAKKIENKLSHYGIIACASGSNCHMDDESGEYEKYVDIKLLQTRPFQFGKSVGFRTLISGAPRSGQQHLASSLLYGFLGHVEIQKLSLATISQEGHADMVHGLTQILWKSLNIDRCVIYMPRIDLWAIDETSELDVCEKVNGRRRGTSDMWNSFVEQVDSAVSGASVTILATCELEKVELPPGLTCFFSRGPLSLTNSTSTDFTIPRFYIHVDGKLEMELVINLAAEKLSYDLILHYIILMHERNHMRHSEDIHKSTHVLINSNEAVVQAVQIQEACDGKSSFLNNVSFLNDQNLHRINGRDRFVNTSTYGLQDSISKTGKALKGNLFLAIATFGYQILRYPQFAELVWVTSKLKEGPCADASGPWKHWPFNTCVIDTECQSDKRVEGTNTCNANDLESSGVVRGLIAVGLLAYRGIYASTCEVSADVRKVLELLILQIRAKLVGRKGGNRYFRILSQVAYLDDMVNSWGYILQSLHTDNSIAEINHKPSGVERLQVDNATTDIIDFANKHSSNQVHGKSCSIVSDISSKGFTTNNDENFNTCKKVNNHIPTKSDDVLIEDVLHTINQSSLDSEEITKSCLASLSSSNADQNSYLAMPDNIHTFKTNECSHDSQRGFSKINNVSDTDQSLNHAGCNPNDPSVTTCCTVPQNDKLSKVSCKYRCCLNCMDMINMMTRKMIGAYMNLNECCSVDDSHEIITSCSLNILTSFRKYFNPEKNCDGKLYCQTKIDDCNGDFKRMGCYCKALGNIEHFPLECDYHTRIERDAALATGSTLNFFFRNGVLVSMASMEGSALHCNFENLCICSVIMILQSIKQTFD